MCAEYMGQDRVCVSVPLPQILLAERKDMIRTLVQSSPEGIESKQHGYYKSTISRLPCYKRSLRGADQTKEAVNKGWNEFR